MTDERPPTSSGAAGPPAVPVWVMGLGVAILVLVAIVVVVMLLSGGQHGPGRHG